MLLFWATPAGADSVRDAQWHLRFLGIADAAQYSQGEGVVVAVVDTGVDARHVDLVDAILPGRDVVGNGDGRSDVDGHGTGMAGLIAARGRAGATGAIGVAPRSKIFPVYAGGPDNPFVADAVDLAVENGAQVICLALGGNGDTRLEVAIQRALESDVVVVAGAGNSPNDGVQAPAKYSGVIATTGVDREGRRAEISASGPEAVLAAPAVEIVSTKAGGGYRIGTGTSDATAIVAGIAALVRSRFPGLSAREVVHRLTATATDKGAPGRDDEYGYGIVNPVAALTADVLPLPSTASSAEPSGRAAAPPASEKDENHELLLVGILVGAVLISSAGVGAVIAFRYVRR